MKRELLSRSPAPHKAWKESLRCCYCYGCEGLAPPCGGARKREPRADREMTVGCYAVDVASIAASQRSKESRLCRMQVSGLASNAECRATTQPRTKPHPASRRPPTARCVIRTPQLACVCLRLSIFPSLGTPSPRALTPDNYAPSRDLITGPPDPLRAPSELVALPAMVHRRVQPRAAMAAAAAAAAAASKTLGWAARRVRLLSTAAVVARKSDPLRILFCGSDDFSCESLRALHREHLENPALIEAVDVLVRPGKKTARGLKQVRQGEETQSPPLCCQALIDRG